MLGIRRFQSTALDLWVGPKNLFHADVIVVESELPETHSKEKLHWAIQVESFETAPLFELLKKMIRDQNPRRCTFMLEDTSCYESLEKSFYQAFPE